MQIGCDTFLKALEQWAPLSYAEEWDNCGLQVGRRDKVIGKVMIALTPGEAAIQAAVDANVDLLLTHHPMIFKPTKTVTTDHVLGKSIIKLIQNDINLYCAHTNLDMAVGGVNDVLAKALQLQDVAVLENITEE
ncbi:MAG: Nif3-like dinuclear metal center hexameric protein, partial [Peptococcaceae bacterium]|nr:Nif3-like dinuclear metal center hexameric protein [Peptococcaceae bacterium]